MKHNSQLLEELGIHLQNRRSGTIKTVCPKCSIDRKNKKIDQVCFDIANTA